MFHVTLRYFVPLIPISIIWVVMGADRLRNWLIQTMQNTIGTEFPQFPIKIISLVLVVLVFLCSILPEFGKHMKKNIHSTEEWAPAIEQKKAGLWLKKHGIEAPVIMSYNHAVSFYAGNYNIQESVEIPENKIERILEYARFRNVDYLVLDSRYKQHHPLLADLYEGQNVPAELKIIYCDEEISGLKTIIYEIID
jgi:hypothetical protein